MNEYPILHEQRPAIRPAMRQRERTFEEEFLDRVREPDARIQGWISNWMNPSHGLRIFLVAAIWAIPGYLFLMMLALVLPIHDPAISGTVGALLGALIGGCLEKK